MFFKLNKKNQYFLFFSFFIFFTLFLFIQIAHAATPTPKSVINIPILQIPIPDLTFSNVAGSDTLSIPWIGEYINKFYRWGVFALAVLAVIMIMISGIRWIIAGGSPEKISSAKQGIMAAIIGLILILLIQQILSLINPELVVFKPITIASIKKEYLGGTAGFIIYTAVGHDTGGRGGTEQIKFSKSDPSNMRATLRMVIVIPYDAATSETPTDFDNTAGIDPGSSSADPNDVICEGTHFNKHGLIITVTKTDVTPETVSNLEYGSKPEYNRPISAIYPAGERLTAGGFLHLPIPNAEPCYPRGTPLDKELTKDPILCKIYYITNFINTLNPNMPFSEAGKYTIQTLMCFKGQVLSGKSKEIEVED